MFSRDSCVTDSFSQCLSFTSELAKRQVNSISIYAHAALGHLSSHLLNTYTSTPAANFFLLSSASCMCDHILHIIFFQMFHTLRPLRYHHLLPSHTTILRLELLEAVTLTTSLIFFINDRGRSTIKQENGENIYLKYNTTKKENKRSVSKPVLGCCVWNLRGSALGCY